MDTSGAERRRHRFFSLSHPRVLKYVQALPGKTGVGPLPFFYSARYCRVRLRRRGADERDALWHLDRGCELRNYCALRLTKHTSVSSYCLFLHTKYGQDHGLGTIPYSMELNGNRTENHIFATPCSFLGFTQENFKGNGRWVRRCRSIA